MRTLLAFGLVLALAGAASAQTQRIAYWNAYNATAGEAAATIGYFDASAAGRTTTYASRQEVWNVTIRNNTTAEVTIRLYSKGTPGFDQVFQQAWDDDYLPVTIAAGDAITFNDLMVPLIGWHIENDVLAGTVRIVGWN